MATEISRSEYVRAEVHVTLARCRCAYRPEEIASHADGQITTDEVLTALRDLKSHGFVREVPAIRGSKWIIAGDKT